MTEPRDAGAGVRTWGTALALTAVRMIYFGPSDTGGDRFLAVPLALESGSPGTYPATDLLVQGGMHSGFHLYLLLGKAAAATGVSPALIWQVLLLLTLVCLFYLLLRIGETLGGSFALALIAAVVVLTMPGFRGGLVWTALPWSEFATGSLGHVAVLWVIWLLWRTRWRAAGMVAGLLCNIHPSMGSIAATLVFAAAITTPGDRRQKVQALGLATLLASPNAIAMGWLVLRRAPGAAQFSDIAAFQVQYSLRHYLDGGLVFFATMLAVAAAGSSALAPELRARVRATIATILGLFAVYITGVELLQSRFIGFFFWFRASAYVKAIAVPLVIILVAGLWAVPRRRPLAVGSGFLLLLGCYLQNDALSGASMLLAVAALLLAESPMRLRLLGALLVAAAAANAAAIGWRRFEIPEASTGLREALVVLSTLLALAAVPVLLKFNTGLPGAAARAAPRERVAWALLPVLLAVSLVLRHPYERHWRTLLPASPTVQRRIWRFDQPAGSLASLESWARASLPPDALVVLPPGDDDAPAFRLRARRGVFVTRADLLQLTYSPEVVGPAAARMRLLVRYYGATGRGMVGCRAFDASALRQLRQAGATHFACLSGDRPPLAEPQYADSAWVLYALPP